MQLYLEKNVLGVSILTTIFFPLLGLSPTAAIGALVSPLEDHDSTFQNKATDGRARSEAKASVNNIKFFAQDICNEDISENWLCLDIWGKGSTGAKTITASGGFETYLRKPVDMNKGKWLQLSRGQWSAVDLLTATEKEISFKARTSFGNIFIELIEGKSENSGQVCAYGQLIGIRKAEDAVCVDNAFVVIGKTAR